MNRTIGAALLATFFLAGCTTHVKPYHAPHGYKPIPQPVTVQEYATQMQSLLGSEINDYPGKGAACTIALTYSPAGRLDAIEARGGDPRFCERIVKDIRDDRFGPLPSPPMELRAHPVLLDFKA